jgi:hypothetical protein
MDREWAGYIIAELTKYNIFTSSDDYTKAIDFLLREITKAIEEAVL